MVTDKLNPDAQPDVAVLDEMEQETSLAPASTMALGQMAGDVSVTDLKFPRLQIAYGVGKLATQFTPGDLVLDSEHLLAHKKTPIRVIILNTFTYWKEYLDRDQFSAGIRPKTFHTEAEVIKNGFRTAWVNNEAPQFRKAMDLRLLVRKPDGLTCGLFGLELNNEAWAPAMWSIDKTAYERIHSKVAPVVAFALRTKGMLYGAWDLMTEMETLKNGNVITVPVIKYMGLNPDKLVTDIQTAFGAS